MKIGTVFALLLVLFSTICCFSKARKGEIMFSNATIEFLGIDMAATKDKFSGRNAIVVWEEAIQKATILKEIENYKNWRNSPQFKCIPNAKILIMTTKDDTLTLEVSISNECPFIKFNSDNKTFYKRMPKALTKELLAIHAQIPKKAGIVLF
jgi:hypothetical protein